MSEQHQLIYKYIKGEERSFTIIAYPVPAIGEKFEEIFAETVKLNTLDYVLYQNMQQKLIDVLDTADRVHIVGANGNKTDLYVKIFPLANPEKEEFYLPAVVDKLIKEGKFNKMRPLYEHDDSAVEERFVHSGSSVNTEFVAVRFGNV